MYFTEHQDNGLWICILRINAKMVEMDERLLDVVIGVMGFALLVILLAVLPLAISSGPAYLIAIIIFILFLSGAGYMVNEKIA